MEKVDVSDFVLWKAGSRKHDPHRAKLAAKTASSQVKNACRWSSVREKEKSKKNNERREDKRKMEDNEYGNKKNEEV